MLSLPRITCKFWGSVIAYFGENPYGTSIQISWESQEIWKPFEIAQKIGKKDAPEMLTTPASWSFCTGHELVSAILKSESLVFRPKVLR